MDNQNSPRTYTRRQASKPLEECLTRQQGAPIQPKLPTRPKRSSSLALRWGVIALAAFTGMGSGVGVMALFMPRKPMAPATAIATEPKTVVIPAHPEALIPVADNRKLIASVLQEGGKQDPFAPPPQVVATVFPPAPAIMGAVPPAPLPTSPVLQPVTVVQGQPTTRILPPPAAIASMLPSQQTIQDLPAQQKIQDLPAPQAVTTPKTPSLLDTQAAPQTTVSLSVATNKVPTLVDTADLNVAVLPEAPQPVVQAAESMGLKLLGVATSGDNRIALIRTSPEATPFSASVGDVVGGWKVKTIDENQVIIVQGDQQQILKIGG